MSDTEEELRQNDTTSARDIAGEVTIIDTAGKTSERKPEGIASPVKDELFSRRTNPAEEDDDDTSKRGFEREKSREQKQDDDISGSSIGDICRICHMGGFPPLIDNQPIWEWNKNNHVVNQVPSQISTLSSYAHLGPLISACKCRGTVGLVHAECLERWLTESGHTRCEICGYKYATKRVPRYGIITSVGIWFKTVIATRQMISDIVYLLVTTPLALFSCYICALALRVVMENGFHEIPWMIIAMLPTCSLTLIAYWGWLITLGRLHSRRWRRFWRNNFVVRLLPDNTLERLNHTNNYRPAGPPISIIVNVLDDPSSPEIASENEAEEFLRII